MSWSYESSHNRCLIFLQLAVHDPFSTRGVCILWSATLCSPMGFRVESQSCWIFAWHTFSWICYCLKILWLKMAQRQAISTNQQGPKDSEEIHRANMPRACWTRSPGPEDWAAVCSELFYMKVYDFHVFLAHTICNSHVLVVCLSDVCGQSQHMFL